MKNETLLQKFIKIKILLYNKKQDKKELLSRIEQLEFLHGQMQKKIDLKNDAIVHLKELLEDKKAKTKVEQRKK